jgi:hypothetical protein
MHNASPLLKSEIEAIESVAGRPLTIPRHSHQFAEPLNPNGITKSAQLDLHDNAFLTPLQQDILCCNLSLDTCKTAWHFGLELHESSGSMELKATPQICGERNCPNCLDNRISRFKNSKVKILKNKQKEGITHKDLWLSFKPNLRIGHVMLTNPEILREDLRHSLPRLRKNVNRFTRKLLEHRIWGYGVFELKFNPVTQRYRPHAHLMTFGCIPDAVWFQSEWTKTNGCQCSKERRLAGIELKIPCCDHFHKAEVLYSPSRERGQSLEQYYHRLHERKLAMLDYFARRVAGAGLVYDKVPDVDGKLVETIIGSMPIEDYVQFIKHSRLYFSFGKVHEYTFLGKKVRTNIPQGLLQHWEQRHIEIVKNVGEILHIYLGTLPKSKFESTGGSPPPNSEHLARLKNEYEHVPVCGELYQRDEPTRWRVAFRRLWGLE